MRALILLVLLVVPSCSLIASEFDEIIDENLCMGKFELHFHHHMFEQHHTCSSKLQALDLLSKYATIFVAAKNDGWFRETSTYANEIAMTRCLCVAYQASERDPRRFIVVDLNLISYGIEPEKYEEGWDAILTTLRVKVVSKSHDLSYYEYDRSNLYEKIMGRF